MKQRRDVESLWGDTQQKQDTKLMRRANSRLRKFYEKAEPGKSYTLHEIAEAMGVTRERVRQIEARALKKLHRRLGQIFKMEDITPEEAMEVVGKIGNKASEHAVSEGDSDT